MVDTWAQIHGGDSGTTFSTRNPYVDPADWHADTRIDYILARPGQPHRTLQVDGASIAGGPSAGTAPSDHYAVVADLHP